MFQSNLNEIVNFSGIACLMVTIFALVMCACSTTEPAANNAAKAANTAASTPAPAPTTDPSTIAAELYAQNCSICHRDTGKGGKLILDGKSLDPEDLTTDKMKKLSDDKLIGYVTNGVEDEGMPAFKDKLSADEIKQVVAHVRTLQAD